MASVCAWILFLSFSCGLLSGANGALKDRCEMFPRTTTTTQKITTTQETTTTEVPTTTTPEVPTTTTPEETTTTTTEETTTTTTEVPTTTTPEETTTTTTEVPTTTTTEETTTTTTEVPTTTTPEETTTTITTIINDPVTTTTEEPTTTFTTRTTKRSTPRRRHYYFGKHGPKRFISSGDDCCPEGWSRSGSSCFMFFYGPKTWIDAELSCIEIGGNLASVHSSEDSQFLRDAVYRLTGSHRLAWIGGHDGVEEGVWQWTDGSPFDFNHWSYGEPNNFGHEHCLVMNWGARLWNDLRCSHRLPYVCSSRPAPRRRH